MSLQRHFYHPGVINLMVCELSLHFMALTLIIYHLNVHYNLSSPPALQHVVKMWLYRLKIHKLLSFHLYISINWCINLACCLALPLKILRSLGINRTSQEMTETIKGATKLRLLGSKIVLLSPELLIKSLTHSFIQLMNSDHLLRLFINRVWKSGPFHRDAQRTTSI